MNDFKNHKFYELMWLPKTKNCIWEAKTKKALAQNQTVEGVNLYALLKQEIDWAKWRKNYARLYKNWLENDQTAIFDLENPVVRQMFSAIQGINKILPPNLHFCYWYDIDRTENEDFVWEKSPISSSPLIDLGEDYFYQNRLWDKENHLLLPKIQS